MALTRKDLVDLIRPEIETIFDEVYADWDNNLFFLTMPRRGRYQVRQGHKIVADHIKHRREALAVMKLLKENKDGTS